MESSVGGMSSSVESSMYQSIQAILRELDSGQTSACNKGMLRWTLHKKVESNPSYSVSLVRVLVKELEKAERIDCKMRIIPLLHTLVYAIIQSVHIPGDLYERVFNSLSRLLTLPEPYCSVALSYTRQITVEQITPGTLYQRRVITEHSLRNEHYPLQEKVLVFADPAVFPQALVAAVRADVECGASPYWDTLTHARRVLLHTLQATLGRQCHGSKLAQALEDLGEDVDHYFQEVVAVVEQGIEEAGSDTCSTRLQQIYHDIMSVANQDPSCPGSLCGAPLPSPEISFHLWTKEEEIWNKLVSFVLMLSPAERSSLYQDEDDSAKRSSIMSTVSTDSGIEGDLPVSEFSGLAVEPPGGAEDQRQQFTRRSCVRRMKSGDRMALVRESIRASSRGSPFPKDERNLTARIVVMGDDRVLGRLAKTFYSIRKREARHLLLTKGVNLEMYYIPISNVPAVTSPVRNTPVVENKLTLASFLGSVDPWYDCNINSLGAMILKLAEMQSSHSGSSEPNPFLVDNISYYIRTGQQPVHFPIYSVKISFSKLDMAPVEEVFVSHLEMDFPEFKTLRATFRGSVRYKRYTQEFCGAVVSVNYRKTSISKREVNRGMSFRTCGVLISAAPSSETKDLDSLTVHFSDVNPARPCMSVIRTGNIKIRTLEKKTFTVCLDKDSRRTFNNVQSIEISPCLDPGYCIQKTTTSKHSLGEEKEAGLSQYMNKALTLPINTFSGIIQ